MDRDPIIYRMQDVAVADTLWLRTPPVKREQVWTLEQVSVATDNEDGCYVDLYLDDGSRLTALESLTITLLDSWYPFTAVPVTLLSGYRIACRFRFVQAAPRGYMNVVGYVREPYTSP